MDAVGEAKSSPQRPVAAAITAVVARRVKALRDEQNLSGAKLAERLSELGLSKWNRTTVAKFETLHRQSLTIEELLALAAALGVPPVWLLADLADDQGVSLGNLTLDAWSTILWVTGQRPLDGQVGQQWLSAAQPIGAATAVMVLAATMERQIRDRAMGGTGLLPYVDGQDQSAPSEAEATDRRSLGHLRLVLEAIESHNTPAPPISEVVVARARELGVDLPGVEG